MASGETIVTEPSGSVGVGAGGGLGSSGGGANGRPKGAKRASRTRMVWWRLRATPRFWFGAVVVAVLALLALFGLWLTPWEVSEKDVVSAKTGPSAEHWFGADDVGHDIYARTISGLRISMVIGLVAGPASSIIAAVIGSFAGYMGGKIDAVIAWFINLLLVLPAFYILVLLSPLLRNQAWMALTFFIAAFSWMVMAQVVRGQTKSLRNRDYVRAARFMGMRTGKILRRHIIPNVASLLIVDATLGVVLAILTETALSFFGFGIHPPQTSIGTLLRDGTPAATTRPWEFVCPAAVLVALLFAINLIGDALRDALDPKSGEANA